MTRGLAFWILMLLWLVTSLAFHFGLFVWPGAALVNAGTLFILFALLGWQVFGPPLKG